MTDIGSSLIVWQILLFFVLGKALNSMWILINALQIIVFQGMWGIGFTPLIKNLLKMLRSIAFGEYIEDLAIGDSISDMLGIKTSGASSSGVFENLGISLIVITFFALILLTFVLSCFYLAKRINKYPKCLSFLKKVKTRLFFNPFIRYSLLNYLKYTMVALLALTVPSREITSIITGSLLLTFLSLLSIFYVVLLYKKKLSLGEEKSKAAFGTLFVGLKLADKDTHKVLQKSRRVWMYPLFFLLRRMLFMVGMVCLREYPNM